MLRRKRASTSTTERGTPPPGTPDPGAGTATPTGSGPAPASAASRAPSRSDVIEGEIITPGPGDTGGVRFIEIEIVDPAEAASSPPTTGVYAVEDPEPEMIDAEVLDGEIPDGEVVQGRIVHGRGHASPEDGPHHPYSETHATEHAPPRGHDGVPRNGAGYDGTGYDGTEYDATHARPADTTYAHDTTDEPRTASPDDTTYERRTAYAHDTAYQHDTTYQHDTGTVPATRVPEPAAGTSRRGRSGRRTRAPGLARGPILGALGVLLLPALAVLGLVALMPGALSDAWRAHLSGTPVNPWRVPARTEATTTGAGPALTMVAEVAEITPGQAQVLLDRGENAGYGTLRKAWTWRDRNGLNLLALDLAEERTAKDGSLREARVRVHHLARLEGEPRVLHLVDEMLECPETPLHVDFTTGSVQVGDLDADGVAEATSGWHSSCEGPDRQRDVTLALLSGGQAYTLGGRGFPGTQRPDGVPPATFDADPQPEQWPAAFLTTAQNLFRVVYT